MGCSNMRQWFTYIQWYTFLAGLTLGGIATSFCVLLVDSNYIERYQGLIGTGAVIVAAMYTISVTFLHRDEDKFEVDREHVNRLHALMFQEGRLRTADLEYVNAIRHLPEQARVFIIRTAVLFGEDFGEAPHLIRQQMNCVTAIVTWLNECLRRGRYVPWNASENPQTIMHELLNARERVMRPKS